MTLNKVRFSAGQNYSEGYLILLRDDQARDGLQEF